MTWAWPGRSSAAGWGCAGRALCSSRVALARRVTCRCRLSAARSPHWRGYRVVTAGFIRFRRRLSTSRPSSAATALPAWWWPRSACCATVPLRLSRRCGRLWTATCAAAGRTTGSSARCRRQPRRRPAGRPSFRARPPGNFSPARFRPMAPSPARARGSRRRPIHLARRSPSPACSQAPPRSRPTWRRTRCWPGGWISAGTGKSRSGSGRWSTARASGPRWRRSPRRNSRSPWPGCESPRCPPAPARTRASRQAACRSRTPARRSGRRARRPVTCCWPPPRPGSRSLIRRSPWPTGRSRRPTVSPG